MGWRYVEAEQIISVAFAIMLGAAHHVSNAGKDKRLLGEFEAFLKTPINDL